MPLPQQTTHLGDPTPIVYMMSNEEYHAADGVSKSGLWTIWKKTPGHFRFAPRVEKPHFVIGSAVHTAVLEPEALDDRYECGPDARGNSNEWKDAVAMASAAGRTLLKPKDYDEICLIRESAMASPALQEMLVGAEIERAAFVTDEKTGALVKCKPDLYNPSLGLILDLKTDKDATMNGFSRSVVNYGYHVQEAVYSDVWRRAGHNVYGFVFVVVEKEPPYAVACYELPPSAVAEGHAVYRAALEIYANCLKADRWPMFPDTVTQLALPPWAYQLTPRPTGDEDMPEEESGDDEDEGATP